MQGKHSIYTSSSGQTRVLGQWGLGLARTISLTWLIQEEEKKSLLLCQAFSTLSSQVSKTIM